LLGAPLRFGEAEPAVVGLRRSAPAITMINMPVQPSETMRQVHQIALGWQELRRQQTISMIAGGLAEIPGADGLQMGWGVLGLCFLLTNVVDQIGAGVKASAFAAQTVTGLKSGGQMGSVVGCELIANDDLRANARLQVPPELATRRPGVVASASSAIRDSMASPAFAEDVLDNARDQGRWAGKGMITQLTAELPGLDLTQAGVALLTCGGFLLNQGLKVGLNESTRGFLRTRRKAAEGMAYGGIGLAGAVMALAGDACLARG
jgi:hypothetical protein